MYDLIEMDRRGNKKERGKNSKRESKGKKTLMIEPVGRDFMRTINFVPLL